MAETEDALIAAIQAARGSGNRFCFESDVTFTKRITLGASRNSVYTIDLNGHTICSQADHMFEVSNSATIALSSQAGASTGRIRANGLFYGAKLGNAETVNVTVTASASHPLQVDLARDLYHATTSSGSHKAKVTVAIDGGTYVTSGASFFYGGEATDPTLSIKNAELRVSTARGATHSIVRAPVTTSTSRSASVTIEGCRVENTGDGALRLIGEDVGSTSGKCEVRATDTAFLGVNVAGFKVSGGFSATVVLGERCTFDETAGVDALGNVEQSLANFLKTDVGCVICLCRDGFVVAKPADAVSVRWMDGDQLLRTDRWLVGQVPLFDRTTKSNHCGYVERDGAVYAYSFETDAADADRTYTLNRTQPIAAPKIGFSVTDPAGTTYYPAARFGSLSSLLNGDATVKLFTDIDTEGGISLYLRSLSLDMGDHRIRLYHPTFGELSAQPLFDLNESKLFLFSSRDGASFETPCRFADGYGALAHVGRLSRLYLGYSAENTLGGHAIDLRCATIATTTDCYGIYAHVGEMTGQFTSSLNAAQIAVDGAEACGYRIDGCAEIRLTGGTYRGVVPIELCRTESVGVSILLDGIQTDGAYLRLADDASSVVASATLRAVTGGVLSDPVPHSSASAHDVRLSAAENCRFDEVAEGARVSTAEGFEFARAADGVHTLRDLPAFPANLTLTDTIRFNLYVPRDVGIRSVNGVSVERLTPYSDELFVHRYAPMLPNQAHRPFAYTFTILLEGKTYTLTRKTSALDYMMRVLAHPETTDAERALIRSLGYYMYDAAEYAAALTQEDRAAFELLLDQTPRPSVGGIAVDDANGTLPEGASIGIRLNASPQFVLYGVSDATMRYTDIYGNSVTVRGKREGGACVFCVPTYDFGASDFGFYIDGAQEPAFRYSLLNYVRRCESEPTFASGLNLCRSLYRYTEAAKQYELERG